MESIVRGQASNHLENSVNRSNNRSRNEPLSNIATEQSEENIEVRQPRNTDHEMQETMAIEPVNSRYSDNVDQQESTSHGNWQEAATENVRRERQNASEDNFSVLEDNVNEEPHANWQETINQIWPPDAPENEAEDHILEAQENWLEHGSNDTAENWQDDQFVPSESERLTSVRGINRFIPPDDENVYSMELRELLSRYLSC